MTAYDICVIGGGIHGVGVAQAGAAAGYRVLLLEQKALAASTSGASSKLIHGGLRYLETRQFRLVRESLAERSQLLRLAPDLVRLTPFFIPIYRATRRRPWQIRLGLSLYALLGGLSTDTRFARIPRRRWEKLDGLNTGGLQAVYRYFDAQTDDMALTRAVMHSAQTLGAELRMPATFIAAERNDRGFNIRFRDDGTEDECQATTLVNTAGAWVDDVLGCIHPAPPRRAVELVQGSHIVTPGALEHGAYYLEAPRDRRPVFVLPWQGQTMVGTTETGYTGDPAKVHALPEEIAYLQEILAIYFPGRSVDVIDSFSGLRVLPQGKGSYGARPRASNIVADGGAPHRLVSVYGGKLTSYRATAQKVLALLASALPPPKPKADTATLHLERV